MLIFYLFCHVIGVKYTCGQSQLPVMPRKPRREVLANNPMTYRESERENIAITLNFGFEGNADSHMCKEGTDRFTWITGTTVCTSQDYITEEQVSALKTTLNNVRDWLQAVIKINKYNEDILLENPDGYYLPIPSNRIGTGDIYVVCCVRPINATAMSKTFVYNYADERPEMGAIFINPRSIPTAPQNVNDHERAFFLMLLHEFIHILGMNDECIHDRWISRRMASPYNPTPIENFTFTEWNHTVSLLQTPVAIQYAQRRWNISDYGMELENGFPYIYSITHLESRVFLSELMAPTIEDYAYISDATFALLEDMGWYSCNYSYAENMPFNYGPANGATELYTDFPTNPPSLVYPSNYVGTSEVADMITCSYDFRAIARYPPSKTKPNCTEVQENENDIVFCQSETFYAPDNESLVIAETSPLLDFQYFPITSSLCPANTYCAVTTSNNDSPRTAECYSFVFEAYNVTNNGQSETRYNTFFNLANVRYQCNENNQAEYSDNGVVYTVQCPDASIIHSIQAFRDSEVQPFDLTPLPGDSEIYTYYIISIIVIVILVVAILVIVIVYFCCIRKDPTKINEREIKRPDGTIVKQKRRRVRKRKNINKNTIGAEPLDEVSQGKRSMENEENDIENSPSKSQRIKVGESLDSFSGNVSNDDMRHNRRELSYSDSDQY